MLQQTTVAAVIPYYHRFFDRLPDLKDLAATDEDTVLQLWEGLGYYSRARNLHKAAKTLMAEFDGIFPRDVVTLQTLPGIGRYTAGAIASFAFGVRAPIVEANTLRLYSRLLALRDDPKSSTAQRLLWQFAEDTLPRSNVGDFNHAVMDIGATVCRPQEPDCPNCPLLSVCRTADLGLQAEIPHVTKKPTITDLTEVCFAIRRGEAYLLRRREAGEWWTGLWDFPRCSLTSEEAQTVGIGSRTRTKNKSASNHLPGLEILSSSIEDRLKREIGELTGIEFRTGNLLDVIKHGVTRYRIRLICLAGEYEHGTLRSDAELKWVRPEHFTDFALTKTARQLANRITHDRTETQ